MTTIRYRILDSSGLIAVEPKAEMKRRGLPSPDRMESMLLANAPPDDEEPGQVYHGGMREREREQFPERKKRKPPPESDREWIDGEVARMTRGEKPGKRPSIFEDEEYDDDEGQVFIR